jgi:hypothetical protein
MSKSASKRGLERHLASKEGPKEIQRDFQSKQRRYILLSALVL